LRSKQVSLRQLALLPGVILGVALGLPIAEAPAAEGVDPVIEAVSATNVTGTSATLEAQINPEGSETRYKFRLEWQDLDPPARGEAIPGGEQVDEGVIAAGSTNQRVSTDLTGLQPGNVYWYSVVAINAAGRTVSGPYTFGGTGVYPEGLGPGPPWKFETPLWLEEFERKWTVGGMAREEATQRQLVTEREEQQAQEVGRLAAEAQAKVAPAKPPTRLGPVCVVPSLHGATLRAARHVLAKAHCRLGKVSQPSRHRGALVVTGQDVRRGRKLAAGALVAVSLGPPRAGRNSST
jgi:hypothetical protein